MKRTVLAGAVGLVLLSMPFSASAKTLVYCSEASPRIFDPHQQIAMSDSDAVNPMYNRLVELERGSAKLVPALAESWEVSDDSTVFTFKLRKGVKWQSNAIFTPTRDFNSDDVAFSFKRMMSARIASGNG